ncbi:MAG TPA: hypothetical protein VJV58_15090 [Bradyrhizobium sp.]|uniref:hypothetical protein n=1 Tax=Bradyrhizobium sp. TaxID=376 RepID=UPI002B48DBE0|nr:hypothetical protein [Bradyrhizobium sp.]HKO72251.1 hypothetical protein [Bradyrhizobium sp.]
MTTLPAKLGLLLRKVAAAAFEFAAKFRARIRLPEANSEIPVSPALPEVAETARAGSNGNGAPDQLQTCANSPEQSEPSETLSSGPGEREKLIRRRWNETGVKMWSSDLHGSGKVPLKIQGQAELLPVAPGESSRAYDKLEFRLIDGRVVCEGVVIDPPKARRQVEHRIPA